MTTDPKTRPGSSQSYALPFGFFREIGILNQLAQAVLANILPNGLHPSHFGVLMHLRSMPSPKTPVEIASAMQVTKTTMTHTLQVLSKQGWIKVSPHPKDARAKLAELTPSGDALVLETEAKILDKFEQLFDEAQTDIMLRTFDDLHALRLFLDRNRDH